MQEFKRAIRESLAQHSGLDSNTIKLERPKKAEQGDFAFPCFQLAKERKQPPVAIAQELAAKIGADLQRVEVVATGPFLNFRINRSDLSASVLKQIAGENEGFGHSREGAGKTMVIDFSSPNIAKPLHVGHLRSTIIGAVLKRLHDALGYTTVGVNHIGDWGVQFGKLASAVELWGDTVDLEGDSIRALLALYQRFHEEEKRDESLAERGREAFRELESGKDGSVRATWRRVTELSLRELSKTYARLGVSFDLIRGESFYEDKLEETIERIRASGVTEESDGALIVRLERKGKEIAPALLRKSDGTTLYATRDFAAAFHRWDEFHFDRCLYVVAGNQKLHFEQLFGVLKRMELPWAERAEHIYFGMMTLSGGLKLSTRDGQMIFLDELLDRAVEEALKVIQTSKKFADIPNPEEVATQIGIGAVIFNDLKKERIKDVQFEWDDVLSFEGETGPYLQYTHARMCGILRRAEKEGPPADTAPAWAQLEDASHLILTLGRFPDVVRSAAKACEPSEISQYLLSLCRDLNSWYGHAEHKVLGVDAPLSAARLQLVNGAKVVIANGLRLLGVATPEKM